MADANWVLNDSALVGFAQEFEAPADGFGWALQASAPASVDQDFAAAPAEGLWVLNDSAPANGQAFSAVTTARLIDTGNAGKTVTVFVDYGSEDRMIRSATIVVTGAESTRLVFYHPDGTEFGRGVYAAGTTILPFSGTGLSRFYMDTDDSIATKLRGIGYALGG